MPLASQFRLWDLLALELLDEEANREGRTTIRHEDVEGVTGWAIGEARNTSDGDSWWKDAASLYDKLGARSFPSSTASAIRLPTS